MSFTFTIVSGADKATHNISSSKTSKIGRAKVSDIRINEASVSSNHAVVEKGMLKDTGSTNGTLHNGTPMKPNVAVRLSAGDTIKFGEVEVKVTAGRKGSAQPSRPGTGSSSPNSGRFHDLFPIKLYDKSGAKHGVEVLYGKVVGVFFAAHWNGACKTFAPTLIKCWNDLHRANKPFEVVLVPTDDNSNRVAFDSFFSDMPWLTVAWKDSTAQKKLKNAFNMRMNIPYLVFLDENGQTINTAGKLAVNKYGSLGYPFTKGSGGGKKGGKRGEQDLNQSKRFGRGALSPKETEKVPQTVQELMDEEFEKIIGHDQIKDQLQQFYKKVQLDKIRAKHKAESGGSVDRKRLYHMLFMGPPGTGKTTMANLVAKIMVKMQIIENDQVIFVNNALDLLAGFVGQTAPKVDAKVEEARGGVLFIDEAYSIVKSEKSQKDSFGREAIETIMKHLDPPSCVFIFAGYEKQMEEFLNVNAGLSRRVPYRYTFSAYKDEQLMEIFTVVCKSKGEDLEEGCLEKAAALLATVPATQKALQNAGMIGNWVAFAQMERDDRIDIEAALENPDIASVLSGEDFQASMTKLLAGGGG